MNAHKTDETSKVDPIQVILVSLSIILTILGQILLYTTPIDNAVVVPGVIWWSVSGIGLFIFSLFFRPRQFLVNASQKLSQNTVQGWVIFSLILSILAGLSSYLFEKYVLTNFIPVLSLWFLAIFCYVMAFFPANFLWKNCIDWIQKYRLELFWLGLVGVMGIGLRFYKLGELPRTINGDEARIGLFAQGSIEGTLSNPFALWENIGALYLQFINFFMLWFGPSPFSLRLLPAVGGALAIFTTYLFTRQVAGKRVALIAATLLATSHTHIHFSRTVAVSYIQGTWLIPLEFYLLLSGIEKRSSWRAALGGTILAIHMSIYISAQITLGVVLAYALLATFLLKHDFRPAWRQVFAFAGGFLITFIPEAAYMFRQPTEFLNRINENGTYNSGWMAQEMLLTGKTTIQILFERVIHAFLSLIYYPANDFYGSPATMLSFISAVLFLLGLGYILMRVRSLKFLLLNGYFWGITVAIGVFAIPPSADSYRMLVALPAALIIAAIGLDQILNMIGISWERKPFNYAAITSILLVCLVSFNIWVYFFDFVGKCRYGGDPQTRFASFLGTYVKTIKNDGSVYLLSNDVFNYGTHASVDFLTQKRQITNVPDSINSISPVSGETIIANPDRIEELRAWAHEHPGGNIQVQYDCQKNIMLGYQIP